MIKNKNTSEFGGSKEKNESFFQKLKNDKQYSAKVQLLAWGVFFAILIAILNLSSMSNSAKGNNIENIINSGSLNDENTSVDNTSMLESLNDNYAYDIVISVDKKSMNTETNEEVTIEHELRYKGKAYDTKLEINKILDSSEKIETYYKVDNNYYSKLDNIISSVHEEVIYDIVDSDYIELDAIMDLIDMASLDYVTNYSSGKRVAVYHLKVLSIFSSYQSNEVIEINVEEENSVLKIEIDYSNLFKVSDESITECKLEATITDVGTTENFEVIVNEDDSDENTSIE